MASRTVLDFSRWQFAFTAAFHMTFPAITVGLSVFLFAVYALYLRTKDPVYLQIYRFWKKIFAVGFALGVVAGIVLTFEFGLNWGVYAHDVGPVVGVIIGMEVATAFFLEAGFIGIMLYGDGKVSPRVQLLANGLVALGTLMSTTWILVANSWMQTPAGTTRVNGQFQPSDWLSVIFNPSFPHRFFHMLMAVLIAATWLIAGISAYYLARGLHRQFSRRTFSIAMGVLAILLPWQLFIGDNVAATMYVYQPAKVITMEGNYNSQNSGYNVLVVPDPQAGKDIFQITVPNVGSLLSQHVLDGQATMPGINTLPADERPNVYLVFWGFRLMFYSALIMFTTAMVGLYLRIRRKLYTSRRFLRWVTWTTPVGVLAIIGGWITAETGRQPWVVYGQLRTGSAVSHLSSWTVVASFVGFTALYVVMLTIWIAYAVRQVRRGPEAIEDLPLIAHPEVPAVPAALAGEAASRDGAA
ncbi:MAG: cytochrome ubiquinol oxidase subunit I [Planctomycetaceae bacterium]|nr:cytochrome ubiquinol oxidase subunit I [Planctomycetaceae bacterium]